MTKYGIFDKIYDILTELEIIWRWTVCCEKSLGNKRICSIYGTRLLSKIRHIAHAEQFSCYLGFTGSFTGSCANSHCMVSKTLRHEKVWQKLTNFMTFCRISWHFMTKFKKSLGGLKFNVRGSGVKAKCTLRVHRAPRDFSKLHDVFQKHSGQSLSTFAIRSCPNLSNTVYWLAFHDFGMYM